MNVSAGAAGRFADDEVIGLRPWCGADILPICSAESDTASTTSEFAQMRRIGIELKSTRAGWHVVAPREGLLQCDGIATRSAALTPGAELRLGDLLMIAETRRTLALHQFCLRLLGWDRSEVVEQARRWIRLSMSGRMPLCLIGDLDVALVAGELHRLAMGPDTPFIVCPTKCRAKTTDTAKLIRRAGGGSLCVQSRSLMYDVWGAYLDPQSDFRLLCCYTRTSGNSGLDRLLCIDVPDIGGREKDVPRLIEEVARVSVESLRASANCFTADDAEWVREFSSASLMQIELGVRRLLVIKRSFSVSHAARQLGMAPISLARWMERRRGKYFPCCLPRRVRPKKRQSSSQ